MPSLLFIIVSFGISLMLDVQWLEALNLHVQKENKQQTPTLFFDVNQQF